MWIVDIIFTTTNLEAEVTYSLFLLKNDLPFQKILADSSYDDSGTCYLSSSFIDDDTDWLDSDMK
jgi:hypothetical protein